MSSSEIVIEVRNLNKCYEIYNSPRDRLMQLVLHPFLCLISRIGKAAGLTKHYIPVNFFDEFLALKDISFSIKRGEAVAIIGRNGGGKSTLLEILSGTLAPTSGEIMVHGRVSALLELGSGFNPEYSGRDNVILNGMLLGLSSQEIISRFDEIEAFAEIGEAIDRPVKTYSSGMMMRLAFAVQVLCDPDILIIDEALSVGDFFFQQKCLGFIRGLCARGTTLLFVSHDMGTVRDLCQRGVFIHKGSINFDGSNLDAIRHYFQAGKGSPSGAPKSGAEVLACEELEHLAGALKIVDPLWSLGSSELAKNTNKLAYIISVGIFDENDNPVSSAKLGTKIIVRIHYKSLSKEQVHVSLIIKNKYDQILTAVGSYGMKVPIPPLDIGQEAIFELTLQLSLEAGEYALRANLGQPFLDEPGGKLIDATPWLGPLQVRWNYNKEVPPFYGLVGMNCSGKFLG